MDHRTGVILNSDQHSTILHQFDTEAIAHHYQNYQRKLSHMSNAGNVSPAAMAAALFTGNPIEVPNYELVPVAPSPYLRSRSASNLQGPTADSSRSTTPRPYRRKPQVYNVFGVRSVSGSWLHCHQ